MSAIIETRNLRVTANGKLILRDLSLSVPPRSVFAVTGPSGAGKTTLLKSLNRLLDLTPHYRVEGEIRLAGESIHAASVDPDALRARIGMIFQQPVIFPASIYENVIFGVRRQGKAARKDWPALAERILVEAALWDEVKDRLHGSALRLSVGQQQRLCLARALAVDPEIILMDEPTSSLDQKSAEAIEALMLQLKARRTILLVTHNLGQAQRTADWIARLAVRDGAGEIAECTAR
jgi:phosphate transport system ATP-binding protein